MIDRRILRVISRSCARLSVLHANFISLKKIAQEEQRNPLSLSLSLFRDDKARRDIQLGMNSRLKVSSRADTRAQQ